MKRILAAVIFVIVILAALYALHEYKWREYQRSFVSSLSEVQISLFNYYADNRHVPENVTIEMLQDNLSAKTIDFLNREKWLIYPCEAVENGYEMRYRSDYICVEMTAPLKVICAAEIELDDKSLDSGMGISAESEPIHEKFTNCRFTGTKRLKYIYHVF